MTTEEQLHRQFVASARGAQRYSDRLARNTLARGKLSQQPTTCLREFWRRGGGATPRSCRARSRDFASPAIPLAAGESDHARFLAQAQSAWREGDRHERNTLAMGPLYLGGVGGVQDIPWRPAQYEAGEAGQGKTGALGGRENREPALRSTSSSFTPSVSYSDIHSHNFYAGPVDTFETMIKWLHGHPLPATETEVGISAAGQYFTDQSAYIFPGGVSGDCGTEAAMALIASTDYLYGFSSIADGGDVNGDGYGDLLVGQAANRDEGQNCGKLFVFLGPLSGTQDSSSAAGTICGDSDGIRVGESTSSAGDLNSDGYADILVGAMGTSGTGQACALLGPVHGSIPFSSSDFIFEGSGDDEVGAAVSSGGDVDGDGIPDLLIVGPGDDDGGEDAGAAWLVLGASLEL